MASLEVPPEKAVEQPKKSTKLNPFAGEFNPKAAPAKTKINPEAPAFNPNPKAASFTPLSGATSFTQSFSGAPSVHILQPPSAEEKQPPKDFKLPLASEPNGKTSSPTPILEKNSVKSEIPVLEKNSPDAKEKTAAQEKTAAPKINTDTKIAQSPVPEKNSPASQHRLRADTIKIYSREELLMYRERPECKQPPSGDDVDKILKAIFDNVVDADNSNKSRASKLPLIRQNSGPAGGLTGALDRSGRGGGGGARGGKKLRPGEAPMDIPILPLQKTDNRYEKKEYEGEAKTTRQLIGILNKLTPEKADALLQNIVALGINNENLLKATVNAIFEKALSEPSFSPVYAEFCVNLSKTLLPIKDEDGKEFKFKSLLLNQCQAEFEKTEKKDATEEIAMKQRLLGTIRFIGELYIRNMLQAKIMMSCLHHLYDHQQDEDNIEALCKLLRTVGKQLEKQKSLELGDMFEKLKTMAASENFNSRIRFMIQDVIDLKMEKWVERLETLKVQKISEVHKEDDQEKRRKEPRKATPVALNRGKVLDRYGQVKSPTKSSQAQKDDDDGFSTVPGNKKKRSAKPDSRAAKDSPKAKESSRVAQQKGDAKGKTKKTDGDDIKKPVSMFSSLQTDDENEGEEKSENEVDTQDALENDEEEDDEDEYPEGEDSPSKDVSENIDRLLSDYVRSNDFKEAQREIGELGSSHFRYLVKSGIMKVFDERSPQNIARLNDLFLQLAKDSTLTEKHLVAGLSPVIKDLEELLIDFPLALKALAEFVGPLIVAGVLSLSLLSSPESCALKESGSLGKLAEFTVKNIKSQAGIDAGKLVQLVQLSHLKLQDLFDESPKLEAFFQNHPELAGV